MLSFKNNAPDKLDYSVLSYLKNILDWISGLMSKNNIFKKEINLLKAIKSLFSGLKTEFYNLLNLILSIKNCLLN